jgi:hypothetical protein
MFDNLWIYIDKGVSLNESKYASEILATSWIESPETGRDIILHSF